MGAKQSTHTKKTFIHVNRSERGIVDDSFVIDERLTKSVPPGNGNASPFCSSIQEDFDFDIAPTPDNLSYIENCVENQDPYEPVKVHIPRVAEMTQDVATAHAKLSLAACLDAQQQTRGFISQVPKTEPFGHVQYGVSMQNIASPMGPVLLMQPQATVLKFPRADVETLSSSQKERGPEANNSKKKHSRLSEREDANPNDTSTWTSRMIRNLPNDYRRQDLLDLLDSLNVQFDFVYLPVDWGKRANLGYAFVNLVCAEEAARLYGVLNGFSAWKVASEKVCEVVWGKPDQQSLRKNVERFRNSPVMHPDVPDEFKPMIFTLGKRSAFPAPTKRLRPPRGFNRKVGTVDNDSSLTPTDDGSNE